MSQLKLKRKYAWDDQVRLNYALKSMAIQWSSNLNISFKESSGWGEHGMKVTVLPTSQVCRRKVSCKQKLQWLYYIWHGRGEKSGESKAKTVTLSGL